MTVVPEPKAEATPVHATESVDLQPGHKATIVLQPETSGHVHRIPIVAVTKRSEATYQIDVDGNEGRYGPSPVPPTDVDDLGTTFLPALRLRRKMEITIRDVRATGNSRQYVAQVIGWEEV